MPFFIRPPRKCEARELAKVFTLSFGRDNLGSEEFEKMVKKFQMQIQLKIVRFLVAEEKERVIGLGGETRHGGTSYIGFLAVIPNRRKQGIGSTLFQGLLDQSTAYNPTVELFANPGVEILYQKFGFKDAHHAHVFEIKASNDTTKKDVDTISGSIPQWILELDRKAMGFDRSRLLNFLIKNQGTELVFLGEDGFGFFTRMRIGPLVAKDAATAISLIGHLLSTGPKKIVAPDHAERILKLYSPRRIHSCLKMTYGKPVRAETMLVWSYNGFATS